MADTREKQDKLIPSKKFEIQKVDSSILSRGLSDLASLQTDISTPKSIVQSVTGDWPMFGSNPENTRTVNGKLSDDLGLIWKYKPNVYWGYIFSSPAVYKGKVFVGSFDGYIYCLGAEDGRLIWKYETQQGNGSPAVFDSKVFTGSHDGYIYCLRAEDGGLVWKYKTNSQIHSSPVVFNSKIFFGSYDGHLYCLGAERGEVIWSIPDRSQTFHSLPAISEGKLYIGRDHYIYCLNADESDQIWVYETGGWVYSPVISDGKVFVSSSDHHIYCLNAANGSMLWKNKIEDDFRYPGVSKGKIFVGCEDSYLYCFNVENGSLIWRYKARAWIRSSPAIVGDRVVFISKDDSLYCLNTEDGTLVWNYEVTSRHDSLVTGYSPTVSNGKIFVELCDGYIYCFGPK